MSTDDVLLTVVEAAALLRVSTGTVKALARSRQLPAIKVGRAWRFSRAALLSHVERGQGAL